MTDANRLDSPLLIVTQDNAASGYDSPLVDRWSRPPGAGNPLKKELWFGPGSHELTNESRWRRTRSEQRQRNNAIPSPPLSGLELELPWKLTGKPVRRLWRYMVVLFATSTRLAVPHASSNGHLASQIAYLSLGWGGADCGARLRQANAIACCVPVRRRRSPHPLLVQVAVPGIPQDGESFPGFSAESGYFCLAGDCRRPWDDERTLTHLFGSRHQGFGGASTSSRPQTSSPPPSGSNANASGHRR
jgi:hypothetical protein